MVRRLVLGMMLMGCAAGAQALGLGDIHARSALNQRFDADIDLLSVATGEIDGVRVSLASVEAFERAGVERPYFLSSLRFQPKRLPDGRAVVHLSTDNPIREPYLNFLVEVNWPNGRLVREYTVLLDPPTTTDTPPAQVQTAVTTPATAYTPPAPMPSRAPVPAATQPAVGEYGPIQADETLWAIARRVRPSGVTMEQMMIALQQANPQAFIRGNINLLKKGRILRVPERDEILAINRREARQAYREQQDTWLARRTKSMQESAAATADAEPDAELRIATPRPEGEGKAGAAEDDASKPTVDNLQSDLLIAHENAETARQEAELLRSQVNELEMHLNNMERLLTLKDDQLAKLQSNIAAEPTGVELAPQAEEAVAGAEVAAEPATEEAPAPVSETTAGEALEQTTEQPTEQAAEPVSEAPTEQPVAPAPVYEPEPAETETKGDRGLLAMLDDPLTLGAVGVGVLAILGLLVGLIMRSRRTEEEEEEIVEEDEGMGESILLEPEPEEPLAEEEAETETAASGGDTSFLSEFSPSDVQALQDDTTEVDPLSEADVYIAYGRYQQAEDLLTQALDKEPDRLPLKHKLLDVYYGKPDVTAFVALAKELEAADQHKADEDSWARICEMGRELAPEETMFLGSDEVSVSSEMSTMEEDDINLSELADLAEDESQFMQDLEGEAGSLDSLGLGDSSSEGSDSQTSAGLDTLDIELPDLEMPSESTEQDEEEDILHLDLNLDTESLINEDAARAGLQDEEDDSLTLDDLDDFSELTEELSQLEEASALLDEPIALELPEGEDELDLELETSGTDLDSLAGDLADADEVDTKLDLARAYLEMGDSEGARGLLAEVQEEGNEAQKAEAGELLGKLSDN